MTVACKVLNTSHLVIGYDIHTCLPAPPPLALHVVIGDLGCALPESVSKRSPTVKAGSGNAVGTGHDLGWGATHIAANLLLLLVQLGAANKSEFGVASIKLKGKDGTETLAAAMGPVPGTNLQLDCGEPCATPSSLAIACLNNVVAGMTDADQEAGWAQMFSDQSLAWLFSQAAGKLIKPVARKFGQLLTPSALARLMRRAARGAVSAVPELEQGGSQVRDTLYNFATGGPLGYSFDLNVYNGYNHSVDHHSDAAVEGNSGMDRGSSDNGSGGRSSY